MLPIFFLRATKVFDVSSHWLPWQAPSNRQRHVLGLLIGLHRRRFQTAAAGSICLFARIENARFLLRIANAGNRRSDEGEGRDVRRTKVRKVDEEAFRESTRPPDSRGSWFYEPSVSTRGGRDLQRKHKPRAIWPWIVFWLIAIAGTAILWSRLER